MQEHLEKIRQIKLQATGVLLVLVAVGLIQTDLFKSEGSQEKQETPLVTFNRSRSGDGSMKMPSNPELAEGISGTLKSHSSEEQVDLFELTESETKISEDAPGTGELDVQEDQVSSASETSGLRELLLTEAVERAIHSETPWSDVADVALGFKRAGDPETAIHWLKYAAKISRDPDEPAKSNQRLRVVVKTMISASELELAKTHLEKFSIAAEREHATSDLIKAFAKGKYFEEARGLAATIQNKKVRALAYQVVAEREVHHFGIEEALQTLELIRDRKMRNTAYGKIAASFVKIGERSAAMDLIHRIGHPKEKDKALAGVARVEAGRQQNFNAALALIRDPFFKDQTLRGLIEGEAERRRINVAEASVNRIKSPAEQSKAQEAIVQLQVRSGELAGALQRARAIPGEEARFRAIESVAVAEVQGSGLRAARGTANLIPSEQHRDVTFRKIAQRAAVVGESDGAVETINYVNDPGERAIALANVALTQARYGDDRGAERLAQDANRELDAVEKGSQEAQTNGVLAEVYAETGDSDSALLFAASIDNRTMRDRTYQRLALRFAKSREPDLAEISAQRIEREHTRERTLNSVAVTLAHQVPMTEGFNVVDVLNSRSQQVQFLVALASRG